MYGRRKMEDEEEEAWVGRVCRQIMQGARGAVKSMEAGNGWGGSG